MRALWTLPKAAPALLRHIGAYIELAGLDLARNQREFSARLIAAALSAVCIFFVLFLCCLGVVAYYWDTPYRVGSIAWLAGGFALLALVAGIYGANLARASSPLLGDVRREWKEDRVILERILSDEE